jgi:hypothetical protein
MMSSTMADHTRVIFTGFTPAQLDGAMIGAS